jgi:hypothetical protein
LPLDAVIALDLCVASDLVRAPSDRGWRGLGNVARETADQGRDVDCLWVASRSILVPRTRSRLGPVLPKRPDDPVLIKGPPWLRNLARIATSQLASTPASEPRKPLLAWQAPENLPRQHASALAYFDCF